jgi:chorismate dehydratase
MTVHHPRCGGHREGYWGRCFSPHLYRFIFACSTSVLNVEQASFFCVHDPEGAAGNMKPTIRIGAVNYLNTKPLIHHLPELAGDARLILDLPSRLAEQLEAGELDVALIPVIEYFRNGTYSIVPNIAIASIGPVLSVTLFSRVPWPQIRRVALDVGSRTSAGLTEMLLRRRHSLEPEIIPLPMDAPAENIDADAVLLIGDRAMRACLPGFAHAFDLGQEWHDWVGLPMVYAVWAVRAGVNLGPVEGALHEAKRLGCLEAGQIAHREAPGLGLDAGFCRRYLSNIIRFDLGPREQAGLLHYYLLAAELGLARRGVSLDFYDQPHLVESR